VSTSDHVNQVLELLGKLMEYRSSDVRHRLEKVGRAASHFAHGRFAPDLSLRQKQPGKYHGDWALCWRISNRRGVWRA
jgi:hypothetical protein